jgi:hypothetical protein
MRRLASAGQREAAIWAGLGAQEKGVNLAVALLIADLQRASGDVAGVRTTLEMTAKLRRYTQAEIPLAVLLAQRLLEAGDAKAALTVWRQVLGERERTKEQRIQWLPLALTAARAAPDAVQAQRWDTEYKVLTAPPPVAATTEVK